MAVKKEQQKQPVVATPPPSENVLPSSVDPEDKEKRIKALKKKIKQAEDIKLKKDKGEALNPDQISKLSVLTSLMEELSLLS